ncbi:hypothetical protein [Neisseria bacilliformis]|nr:hypothetical protein [Neisseria bacilliformis]
MQANHEKKTAGNGGADDGGKNTKQPKNRLTFAKWGYFWGYFGFCCLNSL